MSPALLEGYPPVIEGLTDTEVTLSAPEPANIGFFSVEHLMLRAGSARVNLRVEHANDEQEQFIPVVQKIVRLLDLRPNWDSYGARAIAPQAAQRAVNLLGVAASVGAPPPQIVPTTSGGVQLEWHKARIDLEIEVEPSLQVHASFERYDTGDSWSDDVTNQGARLTGALKQLARLSG